MTDNEIIKALECCVRHDVDDNYSCDDCIRPGELGCEREMRELTLDLINRQKAEIEKIKYNLKHYIENNEEKGVVYIPAFVVENLAKKTEN